MSLLFAAVSAVVVPPQIYTRLCNQRTAAVRPGLPQIFPMSTNARPLQTVAEIPSPSPFRDDEAKIYSRKPGGWV
jgi:hypothetical protein